MEPISEVMRVANSFPAWVTNMTLVAIVFGQAAIFARLAYKYGPSLGVTKLELKKAFRAGIVATIGPAIAIFITGVGLMSQVGAPLAVARLSVIGNAMYETFAAAAGATASGTKLGQLGYGPQAFAASAWTMALGGIFMLVMPMVLTKPFSDAKDKVESKNPALGAIIGVCAALGSFAYVVVGNVKANRSYAAASIVSALAMVVLVRIGSRYKLQWLREWSLGIAMIIGMAVATVLKG